MLPRAGGHSLEWVKFEGSEDYVQGVIWLAAPAHTRRAPLFPSSLFFPLSFSFDPRALAPTDATQADGTADRYPPLSDSASISRVCATAHSPHIIRTVRPARQQNRSSQRAPTRGRGPLSLCRITSVVPSRLYNWPTNSHHPHHLPSSIVIRQPTLHDVTRWDMYSACNGRLGKYLFGCTHADSIGHCQIRLPR